MEELKILFSNDNREKIHKLCSYAMILTFSNNLIIKKSPLFTKVHDKP